MPRPTAALRGRRRPTRVGTKARYPRRVLVAEAVLLLLIHPEKGSIVTSHADAVLGGALLSELALEGAVELNGRTRFRSGRVSPVAGHTAVVDPLLASALEIVAEKARSPRDLVGRVGRRRLDTIAGRLVERGTVVAHETRVLGIFRRRRWSIVDPAERDRLLTSLDAALTSPVPPDARACALLGLLGAAGVVERLVTPPGMTRRDVRRRARDVSRTDWAAQAVREAIRTSETAAVVATGTV